MEHNGYLIAYDLLKKKGKSRKKDRGALREHLKSMGAEKVQQSLWYLSAPTARLKGLADTQAVCAKVNQVKGAKLFSGEILVVPTDRGEWVFG